MEKDVPKVNKVIPRSDEDKASLKWYFATSLYNYEAFYNIDPVTLEKEKKDSVTSVDPKLLVNLITGHL